MSEARSLEQLILSAHRVALSVVVVQSAIGLRQARQMSLGDALTAASALTANLELWTHNTEDYRNIPELKLFDPLAE